MSEHELQAVLLSLKVAAAAVACSLPFGIALGWVLARKQFRGRLLLETAVHLPLVLPPVVTGWLLLWTFGRNGPVGGVLESLLGLRLVFDWKGAALAAAVVSFPLMVRAVRLAFAAVDPRLEQAARTLGAGRLDTFLGISLPLAAPGVLAGCVLAFARSMGEFGATIMVAGSIPGATRTIPLEVYALLQVPGGAPAAWRLVALSVLVSAAAVGGGILLERRARGRRP